MALKGALQVLCVTQAQRLDRSAQSLANVSQKHFARKGAVTDEKAHVAKHENLPVTRLSEEVAIGRIHNENGSIMALAAIATCLRDYHWRRFGSDELYIDTDPCSRSMRVIHNKES